MKKLIYLYLIFFSFNLFAQEGIRFEKIPFKEILAKAKKKTSSFLSMQWLLGVVHVK